MATKGRRRYSREFKVEAVRMVTEGGHRISEIERDLGIRPDILRRWKKELSEDPEQAFPGLGRRKPLDEEVWRLKQEKRRLRDEREILRKALAIFSEPRRR